MARVEHSRGLRDEANVGPDPRRARELRPLKDLRWKVADGEPDVRGWLVFASTGRELGVVDDLLVDTDAGEVVMLDVDLKRDDKHTLLPLRASWIDRSTKRVVVDARALGGADEVTLPTLPRGRALSDDEVARFNDDYVRAYGDRGYDADRAYRLRHGDEELRFAPVRRADERAEAERVEPRRLLDADAPAAGGAAYFEESRAINRELADLPREPVVREARRREAEIRDTQMRDAVVADAARREREALEATREEIREAREAREAREGPREDQDPILAEREIDPRELDARVRIDEGATVDERTPVAGVRYDTERYPRHSYGDLDEERVREGRPADDRIVSRRPWVADAEEGERRAEEAERRVYYRGGDDVPRQ
jgi:sporulation protein YlmC with PRC-barrel domain